ncbi:TetR family transcriptional regulator [Paenibacillus naphthalenovorans]|uniref:TetR family transcriptional regulator n=2 Tax=Paenibacillus naphthalenovorans TaxID=162209 RepID=A0A0U2VZR8_9BACL|nr:TetR family transcriptional regulator [Paenibacillus naphthalenovorans]
MYAAESGTERNLILHTAPCFFPADLVISILDRTVSLISEVNDMPRSTDHGEQTKRKIASRAKILFEQKGYAATTMEEIRHVSETSKGSIYYHFKSKEALFLYILELSIQEWLDKWRELEAPLATATEKLYRLAEHYADDFQNPLLKAAEEFSGSEGGDPEIKAKLIEITRMHYPVFQQLLEEGIRSGEFKPAPLEDLTFILFGLLGGISVAYYEYEPERLCALYRTAVDVLLKGIENR